jgi:predicted ATP-grasp superfamily ATP-dependent carboligase
MPTAFVLTHESDPQRKKKSKSIIALAITRSLGRQGIPVIRVHPNRLDHGLTSKYCWKIEICPDFYDSEDKLLQFLLTMQEGYTGPRVLIPASDDCAYFIAKYYDRLEDVFLIVGPRRSIMESILDKKSQYEQAHKLGIPIPETYFPTSVEEVKSLAKDLDNYPYVIKPLVAHQWRRASMKGVSKGKKGFSVKTAQELVSQYEAVSQGDCNVMIQEVIGGRDERLFTYMSYFNERSEPIAHCIRKKIRQSPIDFGYCTMTVSCFNQTVEDQSIRLLQGVGYQGISGVEWKLDPKSGQYKLIEINTRAMNTIGLAPACGVDIPYIAFLDKIQKHVNPAIHWQEGAKWINIIQDVWAARELNQNGLLSFGQWWRSIKGKKVDAVYASDDPRPFIGYFFDFLKILAKSALKRLKFW